MRLSTTDYQRLKRKQWRILALIHIGIVMLSLVAYLFLDSVYVKASLSEQRDYYTRMAQAIKYRAEDKLSAYDTLLHSLAAFMSHDEVNEAEQFRSLAGILVENKASITNIALAKDYIITDVYPVDKNKAVLGFDFRDKPELLEGVEQVLNEGGSIVFGPFNLIQGGRGLIFRAAPVIGQNVVYSVVLELDAFFKEIGISQAGSAFKASVRVADPDQPWLLYGDASMWSESPVVIQVPVGKKTLEMALLPVSGWNINNSNRLAILAVTATTIFISIFGVNYARRLIITRARARQQLVAAIESIDDGFVIFDHEDRLAMCNEKYRSYYKDTKDLLVPGNSFEFIIREGVSRGQYPEAIGREEDWIAERLEGHRNPKGSQEQRLSDDRWLKIGESKTQDGSTVGFRVDISAVKRALKEAEDANRAKTDFLNNVSHEFRTPLSIILGYVAFFRNVQILPGFKALNTTIEGDVEATEKLNKFAGDLSKQAQKAEASGKHLMSLINSVLDWATLSVGNIDLDVERVNLGDLMGSLADEFENIAKQKDVRLISELEDVWIDGDTVRLRQIFLNLISNALKFTDTGHVSLSMDVKADSVSITVQDTGQGIPEDQCDAIFERFAQVDTSTKRNHGGTGLGLAISKSLVDLHGGQITVRSELGHGSTFTVVLPKDAGPSGEQIVADVTAQAPVSTPVNAE